MNPQNIIVVGGYGAVGGQICKILGERFPGRVYAAGRSAGRALAFAASTGGKVKPMVFDLSREDRKLAFLERAGLVVMCLDQADTHFMEVCLRNGTDYLDISASSDFARLAWARFYDFEQTSGTGVIGVGLIPGLSGLLARSVVEKLPDTVALDIAAFLGNGERHGKAAVEWTVDNLLGPAAPPRFPPGPPLRFFEDKRRVAFPPEKDLRTMYRFNFSDQATLPESLGVSDIKTRFGLDPDWYMRLLAWSGRTGLLEVLRNAKIRAWAIGLLGKIKFGSNRFALRVEGLNAQGESLCAALRGRGQSEATAAVAAFVAGELFTRDFPDGLFQIEQLFTLDQVLRAPELNLGLFMAEKEVDRVGTF